MCGGVLTIGCRACYELKPMPSLPRSAILVLFCGMVAYLSLLHNPNFGIYPLLTIGAASVGAVYALWHLLLQFNIAQATSCFTD